MVINIMRKALFAEHRIHYRESLKYVYNILPQATDFKLKLNARKYLSSKKDSLVFKTPQKICFF